MRRVVLLTALLLGVACGADPEPLAEPAGAPTATPTEEVAPPVTGAPASPTATETPPVADPVLTVVATVAPIADVVGQVAGGRVEVMSLVPPGADAHTYEPRPGDVATMSGADAFVGIGYDLNPAAVSLAEANLAAGAPVVLLGEEALADDELIADEEDDGHGHTHGGGDAHSHDDGDGHSHERNPHVWTSVRLTMQMAEHLAGVLSDLDPDGAATYVANTESFLRRLAALDEAIGTATATIPESNRVMVVYHDAWGYFARDYGLEVVAAVQPSDFSEPSASDVRSIIEQVRETGVPALFGSEVFPSQVVEAIAAETGATYVGTLSDDALPGEPGAPEHSYEGLMVANARLIVSSLGGDATALDVLPAG
jgi:ABC-type Zn uptake system ZnuABC Zn-binding protein ZnuA